MDLQVLLKKGVTAHTSGHLDAADVVYREILEHDAHHVKAHYNIGLIHVSRGQYKSALKRFKSALDHEKSISQIWISYIETLIELGDISAASASLNEALVLGFNDDAFKRLNSRIAQPVKTNPPKNEFDALVQLIQKNRLKEAIEKTLVLLGRYPNSDLIYSLQGAAFYRMGQQIQAVKSFETALRYNPRNTEVLNNLGILFQASGKVAEAKEQFLSSLKIQPKNAETHFNLANVLRAEDDFENALLHYEQAILQKPNFARALNNFALLQLHLRNFEEARASLEKAHNIVPKNPEVLNNLGLVHLEMEEPAIAREYFDKAVAIKPNYLEAINNLGLSNQALGEAEAAIYMFDRALGIKSDYPEALNNKANSLREVGKLDASIQTIEQLLSFEPNNFKALNNLGLTLKDKSDLEKAKSCFKKAIDIQTDYVEAHRNLSVILNYNENGDHLKEMEELLHKGCLDQNQEVRLRFSLGKALEDTRDFARAFEQFQKANSLRKSVCGYTSHHDIVSFAKLKKSLRYISECGDHEMKNKSTLEPIFIVGMPRSGTTLVEQVLASHSSVIGGGELQYIENFGGPLALADSVISPHQIIEFRDAYMLRIQKLVGNERFITDKNPLNFRYLPLIRRAFPNAPIIHVQRKREAVVWSNFKHFFPNRRMNFSYDIDDLKTYYQLYQDVITYWAEALENGWYELNYEGFTEQPAKEITKLLNYLTLSIEPSCFEPEKNKRSVRTASQQQVRQKIYTGSSNSWQNYRQFVEL